MVRANIWRGAKVAVAASAAFCGLALAGCDEHVEVIRDPQIRVAKNMTWAWRPADAPRSGNRGDDRPVVSRDVIRRGDSVVRENDPAIDITRRELRDEISRQLQAKGLREVGDPQEADFLVDYHFAVRGHSVRVERVYPGAYPGLVCGPFGCWEGWGYGQPEVSYENVHFREGTFVLSVLDHTSRRLAYRAIGQEPQRHPQFSTDQVQDMVHALLKRLKVSG
jgi:Domain of unknown function (DUF4136)